MCEPLIWEGRKLAEDRLHEIYLLTARVELAMGSCSTVSGANDDQRMKQQDASSRLSAALEVSRKVPEASRLFVMSLVGFLVKVGSELSDSLEPILSSPHSMVIKVARARLNSGIHST